MLDHPGSVQVLNEPELVCDHAFSTTCDTCRLRALCLPAALSAEEVVALEAVIEYRRELKTNEVLYRADDVFKALFAIISGAVKSYKTGADGKTIVTGCHLPGELFGFSGISRGCYAVNAKALEPTRVCAIPFEQLETMCRDLPELQNRLLQMMSHRIVDYHEHIGLMTGNTPAAKRLAAFIIGLSSRAARRGESHTELRLPMIGQDIGNYLGLRVETVSREFTKLTQSGAITKKGRSVNILEMERLWQLACN